MSPCAPSTRVIQRAMAEESIMRMLDTALVPVHRLGTNLD